MKILVLLGILFVCSVQPLIMILSLIMMTLLYSLFLYGFMGSYWYSYMILLVVLSGVLVIFTYVASLLSNEVYEMLGLVYLSVWVYLLVFLKSEILGGFVEDYSVVMVKLWETLMGFYNLFIVIFLFYMMLMVVWLSKVEEGALRNV